MNSTLETANYTPMHYDMNPQTEDLISSGDKLENGMVVLLESSLVKESLSALGRPGLGSEYALNRLKENNRWCEVTELQVTPRYGETNSPLISFVAVYADGTKRKRSYDASYAWFVKKDSLPKPAEPENTEAAEETVKEPQSFVGHSFTEMAGFDNAEGSDDRVEYAEKDAEATMSMFPHQRALSITQEQLELVGEAIRDIIPEAEFRLEDEVYVLELTVDMEEYGNVSSESNEPPEETVTFTQIGTGAKATVPVSELTATKSFIEFHGRIEDIQSSEGPLARAIRETRARSGE